MDRTLTSPQGHSQDCTICQPQRGQGRERPGPEAAPGGRVAWPSLPERPSVPGPDWSTLRGNRRPERAGPLCCPPGENETTSSLQKAFNISDEKKGPACLRNQWVLPRT